MGHYIFFFFFFTSFFIVTLWAYVAKFSSIFFWNGSNFVLRNDFFKNYNIFNQKGEVHECGFSGVEEPLKKLEIQYSILAIFFLIYELEFLLFLPFLLNVTLINFQVLFLVFIGFILIAVSYWYEWEYYLLHFTL